MISDIAVWASLNDQWKQLIIKNIRVQGNEDKLPEFSFWNGTNKNYVLLGIDEVNSEPNDVLSFPVKIDIFSSEVTSLEPLSGTRNLEEFYMGETGIVDIAPICNNGQMTKLCCYNSPIEQTAPLAGLTMLKRLCLSGTKISDISSLRDLKELEKLAIYKTNITNLEPLSGLIKLKKLNINFTKVTDISPLIGLRNLQELHCYGAPIDTDQIRLFKTKCPDCKVINDYEEPENQYDDFQ